MFVGFLLIMVFFKGFRWCAFDIVHFTAIPMPVFALLVMFGHVWLLL